MRSLFRALAAVWARTKGDLPLVAMMQVPLLLLSALPARTLAASHAFPSAPLGALAGIVLRSLPYDLVALACLGLAIVPTRRLRAPDRLRGPGLLLIYAACCALGTIYYLAAGLFLHVGGTPSWELLLMAPRLVRYSSKVVSPDDPLLALAALGFLWPAILVPLLWTTGRRLVRTPREWARPTWVLLLALALAGAVAGALPIESRRERTLRRVSPVCLIGAPSWGGPAPPAEPTAADRQVLERLLGGPRNEGRTALAPLAHGTRNVVLWVLEGVGERFLRSHHPLGTIASPMLERLESRGSVRFSSTHVECPLSVQSTFTLMTGASPPANPTVFTSDRPFVRRAPYLPSLLKAAGYRTVFLNSSYLRMWGETRFLGDAGLDVVEDADTLKNRSRYRYAVWSIEGRALVDRFFEWRDGLPPREPFFAVIWNVESHFPYKWAGMPPEYEKEDAAGRYRRVVEHTDRLLGAFFDGLVERGLDRDTLIVVVGDHGQGMGRGSRPHDRFEALLVSEDDTQVPLVFLHGDLPPGTKVVDTPVTLADLYPTLLDLTGLAVPEGIDGSSLAREYQPRPTVSRAITWWPLAARAGRFKLVLESAGDPPELYDLASDPWETRDVSGRHEDVTQALWAYLVDATERRRREDPSFALFSPQAHLQF